MELKPCPFCGGEAQLRVFGWIDHKEHYGIRCLSCLAQTMDYYNTEEDAIEAWNTRWERKCNLIPAPYREFTIGYEYKCSMCGCLMTDHDSYCSECGARRVSRC